MAYQTHKKSKPEFDPEYVEKKIALIEKGLPIDISEEELESLEENLRGARSFYIDLLIILEGNRSKGINVDSDYAHEAMNLAGTSIALRKIDEFREKHRSHITA
jgi:hypothetical protein